MKKRLHAIYTMHSINSLAGALVGVFVPIYFLSLNYSLNQVFLYYLTYGAAVLASFIATSYFSRHFGLKKAILAAFPFLFANIGMLYALDSVYIPLYLIAVVSAVATSFYWFPLHVFFAEYSSEETMGSNVGKLFAFPQLAAILAPLAGGAIVIYGGFNVLILTAGAFYVLSTIPLLLIPELEKSVSFRVSKFAELFKRYPRYVLIEFVENIREEMEDIIWPIFVFLTFRNIFSIGIIGSLASMGSFFFMLFLGRYSDKIEKKIFIKLGAIIMMGLWIARYYAMDEITFYVLTVLASFFGALILIPFNAFTYNLAKKDNVAEFILFREINVMLARITVYSLALIFVSNIANLFLIGSFSSIFFLFF